MQTVDVFLGLGSNLGNSRNNILEAVNLIKNIKDVKLLQRSKLYKTSPVNCNLDKDFINAVCHLRTSLSPDQLFDQLQHVEEKLGKVKKEKNEPRVIDIDILLYGDQKYESSSLQIPHPSWKDRLFVLIPLSDLIDEILIPVGSKSFPFRIKEYISKFDNPNNETIEVVEHA